MTADHDKTVNPHWPNICDGPTHRARRIANMYRAHLRAARPDLCQQADNAAAGFGETWMLDRPETVDPEQELTTAEAANLVGVSPATIRKWACQQHPDHPTEPLLARFKMRGRDRTYLAGNVLAAASTVRRTQLAKCQS